jgi:hypothetical protein
VSPCAPDTLSRARFLLLSYPVHPNPRSPRRTLTLAARFAALGTLWLTLPLAPVGCDSDSDSKDAGGRTDAGSDRGRAYSNPHPNRNSADSGTHVTDASAAGAGDASGGDAGGGDAGGGTPNVVSAVNKDGDLWLTLDRPVYGTFVSYCGDAPQLMKHDDAKHTWVPLEDDRGVWCSGDAYILDGVYNDNWCLGCDGGDPCGPITTLRLRTTEYVKTGTSPIPDETDAGDGMVPVIERRPTKGPYHLLLTYRTSSCDEAPRMIELPIPQ